MPCSFKSGRLIRSVVPPILRTRSAMSLWVEAKISLALLIEQQMVVAEALSADMPVEILRLE